MKGVRFSAGLEAGCWFWGFVGGRGTSGVFLSWTRLNDFNKGLLWKSQFVLERTGVETQGMLPGYIVSYFRSSICVCKTSKFKWA